MKMTALVEVYNAYTQARTSNSIMVLTGQFVLSDRKQSKYALTIASLSNVYVSLD